MKKDLLFKFILFVVALLALWISREPISAMWTWISDLETVTASVERIGIWGPLVLCILFILPTSLPGFHSRASIDGGMWISIWLLGWIPALMAQPGSWRRSCLYTCPPLRALLRRKMDISKRAGTLGQIRGGRWFLHIIPCHVACSQ